LERLAIPGKPNQQGPGEISATLVDLLLPDQSGMAVLDQIVVATPHIPIVILSSVDEAIVKTAMQDVFTETCQK
jgi:DNA-binding NarL/FixJ family response regulator